MCFYVVQAIQRQAVGSATGCRPHRLIQEPLLEFETCYHSMQHPNGIPPMGSKMMAREPFRFFFRCQHGTSHVLKYCSYGFFMFLHPATFFDASHAKKDLRWILKEAFFHHARGTELLATPCRGQPYQQCTKCITQYALRSVSLGT